MPEKYQAAITAASALSLPCYALLNNTTTKVCVYQPVIRPLYRFQQLGITDFMFLGKYPTVSLVEARQTAENARRLLAAGQDPGEAKQQEKRERQAAVSNTFRSIAAEWHKHRETGLMGNHAARVWDSLEKDVFPMLGGLPVSEIKVSQVGNEGRPSKM